MTWQPTTDGRTHCALHDMTFTPGVETCAGCDADLGSVLYDVDPDEGMLEGDKERIAIANESRQDAQALRQHALPLLSDEAKSDRRDAYKAFELVAKLNRLAIDAIQPVLERKHERGLAREAKRIKGVQ